MSYLEEMQFAADADSELYPDFIWDVVFNEEDTAYYDRISSMSAWEGIRDMRRKYNDPFEYMAALDLYEDYFDYLCEKHGGEFIVMAGIDAGTLPDYVPARPKLKPSKSNKQFLRSNGVPVQFLGTPDVGIYKEIGDTVFNEVINDGEKLDPYETKIPKYMKKMIERSSREVSGLARIENVYLTNQQSQSYDFIVDIMESMHRGRYTSDGVKRDMSIYDIIKEMEEEELLDPDIEAAKLREGQHTYKNGRYVSLEDEDKIKILKDMYAMGIDLIGGSGKGSRIVKLARKEVGYDNTAYMTKKERKQYKKRAKKEKKFLKKKDNDALLEKTLLGNRLDLVRGVDDGTIRFSLADMMRNGDDE